MTHIIEYPLHVGDWRNGTRTMSIAEKGAYIELINEIVLHGEIPDDDVRLARAIGEDVKVWRKIRPVLEDKFIISDGFWRHEKVRKIREKIAEKSADAKANALKRWNSGDATAYANHQPITNGKKTPLPPLPMESPAGGWGEVVIGGKIFNIADHLDTPEWREMTRVRPKWDRIKLIRRYNAWIANVKREIPRSPRAAYVAWLQTQPEEEV